MVAVVNPTSGEFGSSGQLVDGCIPRDVWASITVDRIAGVKPLNDWNEGLKEQRLKAIGKKFLRHNNAFCNVVMVDTMGSA